jgi:hypothetical protein
LNHTNLFTVTEWDWFKLQLRVFALERNAPMYAIHFDFTDEPNHVVCEIYNQALDSILEETKDKETLYEEYFQGWVRMELEEVESIVNGLPYLKENFDLQKNMSFEIRSDYGMGSSIICTITGEDVVWNAILMNALNNSESNKNL